MLRKLYDSRKRKDGVWHASRYGSSSIALGLPGSSSWHACGFFACDALVLAGAGGSRQG
jgi:hypothetical protein